MSPMMQEYLNAKEIYKDCLLFWRLGDFYEMFFGDAVRASKLLDITLTGRDCGEAERAPMCGIPYHAVDNYIMRLVGMGEKIAVCDQIGEPDPRGIMKREITRVITGGTVMEESMLDEKVNNYIACVYARKGSFGLSWADITTGEYALCEFNGANALKDLQDALLRVSPKEILCNEETRKLRGEFSPALLNTLPAFNAYYEWAFGLTTAELKLKKQFGVNSLRAFGCDDCENAISAAGALLEYLTETQKRSLGQINKLKYASDAGLLKLDLQTRRNLELVCNNRDRKKTGSLLWLLDNAYTPMGARAVAAWVSEPLSDAGAINRRLDAVAELAGDFLLQEALRETLSKIKDIERLAGRISYRSITPRECETLGVSLAVLPKLKTVLSRCKAAHLREAADNIGDHAFLAQLLKNAVAENPAGKEGGFIKEGYNKELDELRRLTANGKDHIASITAAERERSGIKNLKVGFNKVFGYYFEVTSAMRGEVPYNFIRKQTLANAERYVTEELRAAEEKIMSAEDRAGKLEAELYAALIETLSEYVPAVQESAGRVAAVDAALSFSVLAARGKYVRPEIDEKSERIEIKGGRHPIVEAYLKNDFVPNDVSMNSASARTIILTGPNMAGKSTFMRQTALITLLAHIGSFVPAERAVIALCDRIFTRIGASDDLAYNQSTFMVEMTETANILNNATEKSLVILDELGRGTSTYDGISVAWGVVEHLTEKIKAKTLFATHYHELVKLEESVRGVKNFHSAVAETADGIVFLHKIKEGPESKSFGVEVAALAGLPKCVVERAREILSRWGGK